jgi:uncharacterized protein YjiS (DUF1127 family)
MHTISYRRATEGVLVRTGLLVLWMGQLVAALAWHAATSLVIWQERLRQRHTLAALDDRMLRDMGLSRSDIDAETRKGFWQD